MTKGFPDDTPLLKETHHGLQNASPYTSVGARVKNSGWIEAELLVQAGGEFAENSRKIVVLDSCHNDKAGGDIKKLLAEIREDFFRRSATTGSSLRLLEKVEKAIKSIS